MHSLTVHTAVALGRKGIKQVHGSFLSDEVKNTSETTQSPGAILFWLKTLARRYAIAAVRRQSSQSIILFDFLVGNTSLCEGFPVFLLVSPFSLLFISAVYGRH